MFWRAVHLRVQGRVYIGMVKQPKGKLHAQYRCDCTVKVFLRECAFMHAIDEGLLKYVVIEVIELHVNARSNRHANRFLGRNGYTVCAVQTFDGSQIGEDEPLEIPLLTQNCFEQKRVCGDRDAIDLVIRSHHTHRMSLTKGGLKSAQHDRAQLALSHVHWRCIGSTFRGTMSGEMFRLGN